MEFYKSLFLWIFYNIIYECNPTNIQCGISNNCFCTKNLYDTEYQCPNENTWTVNIKIGTVHNTVNIQCRNNVNWYNQVLPELRIKEVEYFKFQMCSLPTNFAAIMGRLQINNTIRLSFVNSKDLGNVTLTSQYFKGLHNLERLTLNYLNVTNIAEDAFQSLDKLIELNLEDNRIQLTDGVFKDLKNLKLLTLADNELKYLPRDIFKNLPTLIHLGLSYNKINIINSETFKNLKNLKILQLRDMQLEELPENIFYHLENLLQIDVSINNLQYIPSNIFKNNKLLEVIMMHRNPNIIFLPNFLFSNLTKITKIFLNECNLSNLPNELFKGSIHLQRIDLQSNQIKYIPNNIFEDLEELQGLDLSYNKIDDLSSKVFFSLTKLNILNLQNNLLTNIKTAHFCNLRSLVELNLKNNKINFIEASAFQMMNKLKTITLANNYLDLPKVNELFVNNVILRTINLSGNNITVMGNFTTFTNLQKLDISYNQITFLNFSEIFDVASFMNINLENNNISTVYFNDDEVMAISNEENRHVFLNGNPLKCNCHMFNFLRYLERGIDVPVIIETDNLICSSPNEFINNIPVTELKPSMLTCSLEELGIEGKFIDKCAYSFRTWDKALIVNCSNSKLIEAPALIYPTEVFFNQTEIYLDGNLLTTGPRENMGYSNVTKLSMSSNFLREVSWIPPKLKVLELDNNNISYLNYEILNSSTLTNITLGNNPWNCDCSTVDLILFLVSKLSKNQLQIDVNTTTITCRDSGKLLLDLNSEAVCPKSKTLVLALALTVSLIVLLFMVVVTFYYCYHEEIKIWLFAHKIFSWLIVENEIDKDKRYDAFISYSEKDQEFVLNELLPGLEQCPQPYKLCLRIRDWLGGELIHNQITTSVSESRRTIVILSRNFLNSEWGKMEFRTAHLQAIQEGARVILVLYGDIDINSDLDDELKAFTRTNTYIKWGDPWFWNRLRYALPHLHQKRKRVSHKTKNVTIAMSDKLNKVDDRLDLIDSMPSSPDPGSTPPINYLFTANNELKFKY